MRKIIMPKRSGVYKIVNITNDKVYVGSTQNLCDRRKTHFHELRRGINSIHLQSAYDKYGKVFFIFVIIEFVENIDQLDTREQYWIDFYKSYDPKYGYNICPMAGSTRGVVLTEGHKIKIGLKMKGRKYSEETLQRMRDAAGKGENNRNYGKTTSEETKQKQREAGKRMVFSDKHRQGISDSKKGVKFSKEHCQNIRLSKTGENHPNWGKSSGMKGKKQSEESKERMRIAQKERWKQRKELKEKENKCQS